MIELHILKDILLRRKYGVVFLVFSAISFFVFVFLPSLFGGVSDVDFIILSLGWKAYLAAALSIIIGSYLSVQFYLFDLGSGKSKAGILGGLASFPAFLLSSITTVASCASCLLPFLSVFGLGIGASLFLVENQLWILLISIVLSGMSLFVVLRHARKGCKIR